MPALSLKAVDYHASVDQFPCCESVMKAESLTAWHDVAAVFLETMTC